MAPEVDGHPMRVNRTRPQPTSSARVSNSNVSIQMWRLCKDSSAPIDRRSLTIMGEIHLVSSALADPCVHLYCAGDFGPSHCVRVKGIRHTRLFVRNMRKVLFVIARASFQTTRNDIILYAIDLRAKHWRAREPREQLKHNILCIH